MSNKFVKGVIGIVSLVFLMGSLYNFYNDFLYFISKREATGKIHKILEKNNHEPFEIYVKYYNEYTKQQTIARVKLEARLISRLKADINNNEVKVLYGKPNFEGAYIKGFNVPKFGILFFDLILVLIMALTAYVNLSGISRIKRTDVKPNDKKGRGNVT